MSVRVPIEVFVAELRRAVDEGCGYIMGSKGQDPKRWAVDSWWYEQYEGAQHTKALYWRAHAPRVYDCNGLAEGIYEAETGININSKARYNYSDWCEPKGDDMAELPRVPGAAVFMHSRSKGYITHVGYLVEPVEAGDAAGDWWVIEARGVMYGVVRTRLSERGWNRWGLMTKYFAYDGDVPAAPEPEYELGERILRRGMSGADVKQMQMLLIDAGISCGRYGADGVFGSATLDAVKSYQEMAELSVDGVAGPKTLSALKAGLKEDGDEPAPPTGNRLTVTGGSVYLRDAPSAEGRIVCIVHRGDELESTGERAGRWREVWRGDERAWISDKYVLI